MVLYYIVLIGFGAAVLFFFVNSHYLKPSDQKGFAGEMQLHFLEEASKIQGGKYYFEQAARESAHQTALNLAYLSGFKNLNLDCGTYGTTSFWNNKTNYCWPDYKNNFLSSFGNSFEELADEAIDGTNYDYFIRSNILVGSADSIVTNDFKYHGEVLGQYHWRPSFAIKMSYNIDEYKELFDYARELIVGCTEEEENCIDHKLGEFNAESDLKWQKGTCAENSIYDLGEGNRIFCVKGKTLRIFNGKEYQDRQVEYQFGLNLAGDTELLT